MLVILNNHNKNSSKIHLSLQKQHLQEADVVLLTPQRSEDLKEIKKVVKVPVGVISLRDYGLLDGSSIIKYAKQLIQK